MDASSIFDPLFDPAHPSFTEEGIRRLLTFETSAVEKSEMAKLADKANEGTLTPVEQRQYESWVRSGTLISLLQAKARLYQRQVTGG